MRRVAWAAIVAGLASLGGGGCVGRAPRAPEARPVVPAGALLLPARVRRLTNAEYEATVQAVVGAPEPIAERLPPDVRQNGYTENAEQTVPPAWEASLDAVARDVAHRTVAERLDRLVPCAKSPSEGCAAELVDLLGRRAWRRPLDPRERTLLLAVFAEASAWQGHAPAWSASDGFAAGAEALLRALLESPSLLYLTELGRGGAPGAIVTLTPFETASLLSYTVRGAPPDEALVAAAASGAIVQPEVREEHARRLLALSDTRRHFRRFILEWLEVDGLGRAAKSPDLFPGYEEMKPLMLEETSAFADEVMVYAGGSVRALLDARFASVEPDMARFYGLKTWGTRASLAGTRRSGVLQQASFLAAHAHEDGTSPVKRGDFVLRKLLCVRVPRPAEVGIETVFPPPSRAKTTRERFAAHVDNPSCSGCHATLDALGDTFEAFDAIGRTRAVDNGKAVDTGAQAAIEGERLSFTDSLELSEWLATNPRVADCYLRQAFRYFTAQADPKVESALVGLARTVPPDKSNNLFEALIAYVRSDFFVEREVRP
jgi:hypothetical protein